MIKGKKKRATAFKTHGPMYEEKLIIVTVCVSFFKYVLKEAFTKITIEAAPLLICPENTCCLAVMLIQWLHELRTSLHTRLLLQHACPRSATEK